MKPLAHHILIYDRDCPLCAAYTQLFVRFGFLETEGRKAYQDMDFGNTNIDTELARNKIALLNTETSQAVYGIDAMTKVLGHKFPVISFCMRFKPLYSLMAQLYSLISFNRKIILPVSCKNLTSCNPTKSWFWRIVFILFCFIPVQLILPVYLNGAVFDMLPSFFPFAVFIFFGQILFQWIMCKILQQQNFYDYIGHISFVTALGAILLTILLFMMSLVQPHLLSPELPTTFGMVAIVICMLLEHQRRMLLLDMSKWLTVTWALYYVIVYAVATSI